MSKQMTPCEKLGYKVGDKFTVIKDFYFEKGTIVALSEDDGSEVPWFTCGGVRRALIIGSNPDVEPTPLKLKPAKQALADAIHQNGGWMHGAEYAAQDKCAHVTMFRSKPIRHGNTWLDDEGFDDDVGGFGCDKIQNWHQCILSRDEYFTAYPEQVKIEIGNGTKHKVEVEMTSESEVTINVVDWHKNGDLPPAGTWCTLHAKENNGEEVMFIGVTSCNSPVFETVQNMIFVERGEFRFSPLRTEREMAIDEMIKVINRYDYYGSLNFDVVASDIANAMFDEGFRKEVK